jgi:hypothetical protein
MKGLLVVDWLPLDARGWDSPDVVMAEVHSNLELQQHWNLHLPMVMDH